MKVSFMIDLKIYRMKKRMNSGTKETNRKKKDHNWKRKMRFNIRKT